MAEQTNQISPLELRAFREGLGLSRREFAPRLFISEPTLERWERGQGGPRLIHLRMLQRMREHLGAGRPVEEFRYDVAEETPQVSQEPKRIIARELDAAGATLEREGTSEDGSGWWLAFRLPWVSTGPVRLSLACEGSYRLERPSIDFLLSAEWSPGSLCADRERVHDTCRRHKIFYDMHGDAEGQTGLQLSQRIFNTSCSRENLQHVLRNCASCWDRISEGLHGAEATDAPFCDETKRHSGAAV